MQNYTNQNNQNPANQNPNSNYAPQNPGFQSDFNNFDPNGLPFQSKIDETNFIKNNQNSYVSPQFQPTQVQTNSTQNIETTKQEKFTKKKTNPLIRILSLFLILIIVAFSGILVFVLINPENEISRSVVDNTFLKSIIDLPSQDTNEDESNKLINNIIGQQNTIEAGALEFKQPGDAQTVPDLVDNVIPSVLALSLKSKGEGINLGQDLTAGSGYIVTEDGLVISNKHVVNLLCTNDRSRIEIIGVAHNQKAYSLELLSIDPIDDISILRVKEGGAFQPVELADSNGLRLGQEVVAIGNVLGELQNTITKGIVSGLNRSFETELEDPCTGTNFQADGLIQTDAAINRGNSGGPLFNASGQLIGMNTLGTVDAQNIGLAIPSQTIKTVLDGFSLNNQIVRARIGVATLQITSLVNGQNPWIPTDYGEIVFSQEGNPVAPNSAAERAGLQEGDIVLQVNGNDLISTSGNPAPLRREILSRQPGDIVALTVLKSNSRSEEGFGYESEPQIIEVTLGSIRYDLENNKVLTD